MVLPRKIRQGNIVTIITDKGEELTGRVNFHSSVDVFYLEKDCKDQFGSPMKSATRFRENEYKKLWRLKRSNIIINLWNKIKGNHEQLFI